LARRPALLLLDEPFSNLDAELRQALSLEVRDILKCCRMSAVLVTHDQEEAFAFADQIGVLNQGQLQQWDTPRRLYHEPANRFVANFIGHGSFIGGVLSGPGAIATELGQLTGDKAFPWPENSPVDVLIRPDDVAADPLSPVRATIVSRRFTGGATLCDCQLPSGQVIEALLPSDLDPAPGAGIGLKTVVQHLIAFEATPR
jgi:iron(III) transport system ATP-binding protein